MDSGDGVSQTMPIYEAYALPHAIFVWIWLAVTLHTECRRKILIEREYAFTATAEREISFGVKEKLCCIAFDYDTEHQSL